MAKPIHNPHDHFFRSAMSDIRVAREFFIQHLPKNILSQIDLQTLRFQKISFIDTELKTSAADVLYSVSFNKRKGYLYVLVEHQSSVDKWITFRVLKYMVRALEDHRSQYPEDDLPVIYPLIFYNGGTKYTASSDLFELFGEHKDLAKVIFIGPYQLIDTQQITDEELRKYQWAGILEFVLKHRFARDFLIFAEEVTKWLHQLETDGYDYVRTVLKYVVSNLEGKNIETLVAIAKQQLTSKMGDEVMTFADQAKQKGFQEGLQEGKFQQILLTTKKLLEKGLSLEIIAETTGLTISEIEKLSSEEIA